jgi:hypothetical protein
MQGSELPLQEDSVDSLGKAGTKLADAYYEVSLKTSYEAIRSPLPHRLKFRADGARANFRVAA